MSDYTPKREKDTIDAAVTSASKVPGSLTLNELNAISDKGLVVSGGSEEGPIKTATVTIVGDSSIDLTDVFLNSSVSVYYPSYSLEQVSAYDLYTIEDWNYGMANGAKLVVPTVIGIKSDSDFGVTCSGSAEIIPLDRENGLHITGDCTITITEGGGGKQR